MNISIQSINMPPQRVLFETTVIPTDGSYPVSVRFKYVEDACVLASMALQADSMASLTYEYTTRFENNLTPEHQSAASALVSAVRADRHVLVTFFGAPGEPGVACRVWYTYRGVVCIATLSEPADGDDDTPRVWNHKTVGDNGICHEVDREYSAPTEVLWELWREYQKGSVDACRVVATALEDAVTTLNDAVNSLPTESLGTTWSRDLRAAYYLRCRSQQRIAKAEYVRWCRAAEIAPLGSHWSKPRYSPQ